MTTAGACRPSERKRPSNSNALIPGNGSSTIGRIRREHFVRGKSIKEIVRALKVSRNTVRKVLRSGATSFEYMVVVQPRPKLGSWHADLDGMLSANEGKPARERLTLIRIFEELRGLGYERSYDAVRCTRRGGVSSAAQRRPMYR